MSNYHTNTGPESGPLLYRDLPALAIGVMDPDAVMPLLPVGLAYAAGYTRLDQFTTIGEADIRELYGVGPRAIALIRSAQDAWGLSFADPDSP